MFEPRLALASLSGAADAEWALAAEEWVGAAFLGGVALDAATREAARDLEARRGRPRSRVQRPDDDRRPPPGGRTGLCRP
jgi:hypothetical protein